MLRIKKRGYLYPLNTEKFSRPMSLKIESTERPLFFRLGRNYLVLSTAEFVSKLNTDRAPIAAEALTVDTSILTAIANDYVV